MKIFFIILLSVVAVSVVLYLLVARYVCFLVVRRSTGVPKLVKKLFASKEPNKYREYTVKKAEELKRCVSEEFEAVAADGTRLHAKLILSSQPSDTVVLGLHGYRGNGLDEFAAMADYYRLHGYNLFLPDHRASGQSGGDYIGFAHYEHRDAVLWFDVIKKRFGGNCKIIIHGVSMGSATAMMMSDKVLPGNVRYIIADCGYTSAMDEFRFQMKKFHFPPQPALCVVNFFCRLYAKYDFNDIRPIDCVKKSNYPILFVHGSKDDFVPTRMVNELYDACTSPKDLLIVEGAVHAQSYFTDPKAYNEKIEEFSFKYSE